MLFVILGHSGIPIERYLLAFHMPLFFFISGMMFAIKPMKPFPVFIRSRFMRLIIPYFLFELISLGISVLLCYMHNDPISIPRALSDILLVRPSFGAAAHTGLIYRYWFFPCLFFASIIIYPVLFYFHNPLVHFLSAALLLLAGFLLYCFCRTKLPCMLDTAVVASGYLILGFALFQPALSLVTKQTIIQDLLLSITGISGLVLSVKMNTEDVLFYVNEYGSFGWMLSGSFCGILVSLILAKYLYRLMSFIPFLQECISKIGFNSLAIFPVHIIVAYFIVHIHTLPWLPLFLVNAAISLPVAILLAKYFPFLVGIQSHKGPQLSIKDS